jgi:hypothetical protein
MQNPFAVTISHLSTKAKEYLMELWPISQDQVWSFLSSWILDSYKKKHLELSQLAITFWNNTPVWKNIFSNESI